MALDSLLNQNPLGSDAGSQQVTGPANGSFEASPSKTDTGNWSQTQQAGSSLDLQRSQSAVALNEVIHQQDLTGGAVDSLIRQGDSYSSLGGSTASLLAEAPNISPIRTLMVIDQSMPDWRNVVVHAPADADLLLLDGRSDGVQQISDFLGQQPLRESRPFDTVAIVSEGNKAKLQLGNGSLESTKLSGYTDQLRSSGPALSPEADILIFASNGGAQNIGTGFVPQLAQLNGANNPATVTSATATPANNERTGNNPLTGDLRLEVRDQTIQADAKGLGLAMTPYLEKRLDSNQLKQAGKGPDLADGPTQTWQEALTSANQTLTRFAKQANFNVLVQEVFGTAGTDSALFDQGVNALQSQLSGEGLGLTVELRSNTELNGAAGAYAAIGHTGNERIYLNANWIANDTWSYPDSVDSDQGPAVVSVRVLMNCCS